MIRCNECEDNRRTDDCSCLMPGTHAPPSECAHRHNLGPCLEHLGKQQYFERLRQERDGYNRRHVR